MALDESINEDDLVMEDQGIKVVCEDRFKPFADNAVIDYRRNIFGQGQFQVITGYGC
ncbi:MAG: hypothetical protein M0Z55_03625 [Peptococcaceae bacterium]|nr:hypothetical protein [Peptococcaceae bacterium]